MRSKTAGLVRMVLAVVLSALPCVAQAGVGDLAWDDDGSTFARFGPNQSVTIAQGFITFACDAFFPTADIYVVRGTPALGSTLQDVGGEKNTVFGATGGLFTDTIGFTTPSGKLGPGRYTVVYDECQNGTLDPGDSVFTDAFEVVIPPDVPDADPAILALKAAAGRAAARWDEFGKTLEDLEKLEKAKEKIECILGVAACFVGYIADTVSDAALEELKKAYGLPTTDVKDLAKDVIRDNAKHYLAIKADPPDPAFRTPATLSRPRAIEPSGNTSTRAVVDVVNAAAGEAAGAQALLVAIERYKGADLAGDATWALLQARHIALHARLLAAQIANSDGTLVALRDVVAADPADLDALAAALGTEYARIAAAGWSDGEMGRLRSLGLTRSQIALMGATAAERAVVGGFTRAGFTESIDGLVADHGALASVLQALATDADALAAALSADPSVIDGFPSASAGGPYAVNAGAPVTLGGSAADADGHIRSAAWDLDGDGQFDDAFGLTPVVRFSRAFSGLIGLLALDDEGKPAVSYADIAVTGSQAPEILSASPEPSAPLVTVGSTQTFTIEPFDPDGDALVASWTVDGQPQAAGSNSSSLEYAAGAADVGPHIVEAAVSDGTSEVRQVWTPFVVFLDADGDGWSANVDCDDANPGVSPGAFEVIGNGIDDDCNAATADDGIPAFQRLETITVPVRGESVTSSTTLLAGVTYRLRGSGTFSVGFCAPGDADIEHAFCPANPTEMSLVLDFCAYDPRQTDIGVAINDPELARQGRKAPFWGPYNPSHVYTIDFVGSGAPLVFNYHDCGHADNFGSLKVEIFTALPGVAPPVLSAGPDRQSATGEVVSLAPASFSDDAGPHVAHVEWGDGTAELAVVNETASSGTILGSHAYAYPGAYPVVLTLTDPDGLSASATFTVNVTAGNLRPRLAPASGRVNEGGRLTIPVFAIDPEGDGIALTATGVPGSSSFDDLGNGVGSLELHPSDDASIAVEVAACDAGGCTRETMTVVSLNVAPVVFVTHDGPVALGAVATVTAHAADPGSDSFDYAFDCDGAGVFTDFGASDAAACSFALPGSYAVGVRVRDDDGGIGSGTATIVVRQVVSVLADAGPDRAVDEGSPVVVDGSGSAGTSLSFEWRQLQGPPVTIANPASAAASFSAPIIPGGIAGPETLVLQLSVTDPSGGFSVDTVAVTVRNLNHAPVPQVASLTTDEDSPLSLTLSAADADGDGVSFSISAPPEHGTLSGSAPNLLYTPAPDYFGPDRFVFAASDGAASASATVSIDVAAVNDDPPLATEACFVVDFREITYFDGKRVLASSDAGIRARNGISGAFDPGAWPYRPRGGRSKTASRPTLFRIYGFDPAQAGARVANADDASVGYTVQADAQIPGAHYVDLGGPARVRVCVSQLQTSPIDGQQRRGVLAGAPLTDSQRNVPGILLAHNADWIPIPKTVRDELAELGMPLVDRSGHEAKSAVVDYVAVQLWGHGNERFREFVDVEVRWLGDDPTDRPRHYAQGFHTARNVDFESPAGCNYLDWTPGNDALRLNDTWDGDSSGRPSSALPCGSREPSANQRQRADYALPFAAVQLLSTVNVHDDSVRLSFGPIRVIEDPRHHHHRACGH